MSQDTDRSGHEPRPGGIEKLSPEIDPPAGLEDRVVGALRREGLVRAGKSAAGRGGFFRAAALAAGLLLAAALGFAGGWVAYAPAAAGPGAADYILLVRPGPAGTASLTGEEEMRRFREYSRWVRELAGRGKVVGAEKLADGEGFVLSGRPPGGPAARERLRDGTVEGYFLIRASSDSEAERIASTCPHLKYGGILEVRPIDRPGGSS